METLTNTHTYTPLMVNTDAHVFTMCDVYVSCTWTNLIVSHSSRMHVWASGFTIQFVMCMRVCLHKTLKT